MHTHITHAHHLLAWPYQCYVYIQTCAHWTSKHIPCHVHKKNASDCASTHTCTDTLFQFVALPWLAAFIPKILSPPCVWVTLFQHKTLSYLDSAPPGNLAMLSCIHPNHYVPPYCRQPVHHWLKICKTNFEHTHTHTHTCSTDHKNVHLLNSACLHVIYNFKVITGLLQT